MAKLRAVRNWCPHKGAPICRGIVGGTWPPSGPGELAYGREGEVLVCPWHGFEYDLKTGKEMFETGVTRLRMYPVSVQDGQVYVDDLSRRIVCPSLYSSSPTEAAHTVEAAIGASVMRAAIMNDVEGILAECGGAAACATCHVFIEPNPAVPPLSEIEDEMLDATAVPRAADSRLGCQVFVTAQMDGLEVRLPESQL